MAYVEFFDVGSVHNALALTGKKLLGIPMIVEVSEAEKNRIAAANALYAALIHLNNVVTKIKKQTAT